MSEPDFTTNPTGIDPAVAYPRIAYLGTSLDCEVFRIPDGVGTCSDGTNVYLEARYVELIGTTQLKGARRVGLNPIKRAKAIYFLLHEHGHILQHRRGETYKAPQSEEWANTHAAAMFKWYCNNRLGLHTDDTTKLWRSLPSWYRKPTAV